MVHRRRPARSRRGGVSRIEIAVAHDLESVPVKGVCARRELIGRHPLCQAILSRKRRGQDAELTYHLEGRVDISLQALRFRLGDSHSVKYHFILKVQTAINAVAEAAAGHPWRNKQKIVNLSAASADVRAQREGKVVYNRGFH